jgi:16S rRNA (adenine1518-N6/adenine1519-N6)-dimethyltransferase
VTVIEGDVLKAALPEFHKIMAIPPYYLSSRLVVWLFEQKVVCSVLVLQREFANRLVAEVGSEDYGWLRVLACHAAEVELLDAVTNDMFYPQPEVDSVITRIAPWKAVPFEVKDAALFKRMVRWLFNQRNKKLDNALVPFIRGTFGISKERAKELVRAVPFGERRVRELAPEDFGALANVITE